MPVGNTALITRCPDCATAFRASAEQLALREGRVRCGHCGSVFDAYANTVATTPVTAQAPHADSVDDDQASAPQDDHDHGDAHEALPADEPAALPIPDGEYLTPPDPIAADHPPIEAAHAAEAQIPWEAPSEHSDRGLASARDAAQTVAASDAADTLSNNTAEAASGDHHKSATLVLTPAPAEDVLAAFPVQRSDDPPAQPDDTAAHNLEFDFGRRRGASTRLSPWLAWPAALLLLLALAAQAAFSFRGDLVLLFPALKPAAAQVCAEAGCTLPLPQRAELMSIEASDLQADSSNPGVMVLSATLRNRAPFAQTPPALELTLTDTQDQPVARRVLTAADYFARSTSGNSAASVADNLFPAGAEVPVKVFFDASTVKASGYRLYLFYP